MAKSKNPPPDGGDVGYGRPPVHSRFKPGVSGNPGGRKTGVRNLKTEFDEVLERMVEINENGKKQSVPLVRALILRWAQEALKGDTRAIERILDRRDRYQGAVGDQDIDVSDEDVALIERALKRRSKASKKPTVKKSTDGPDASEEDEDV